MAPVYELDTARLRKEHQPKNDRPRVCPEDDCVRTNAMQPAHHAGAGHRRLDILKPGWTRTSVLDSLGNDDKLVAMLQQVMRQVAIHRYAIVRYGTRVEQNDGLHVRDEGPFRAAEARNASKAHSAQALSHGRNVEHCLCLAKAHLSDHAVGTGVRNPNVNEDTSHTLIDYQRFDHSACHERADGQTPGCHPGNDVVNHGLVWRKPKIASHAHGLSSAIDGCPNAAHDPPAALGEVPEFASFQLFLVLRDAIALAELPDPVAIGARHANEVTWQPCIYQAIRCQRGDEVVEIETDPENPLQFLFQTSDSQAGPPMPPVFRRVRHQRGRTTADTGSVPRADKSGERSWRRLTLQTVTNIAEYRDANAPIAQE